MKRSETRIKVFALLMIIGSLFIGFVSHSVAVEETGTFSGRVVNVEGNPVAKLPVMIGPAMVIGERILSAFFPTQYSAVRRALTDADGRFSITDIAPGPAYFGALPYDIEARLPDDFVADITKAVEEDDVAALHATGIMKMKDDDFEPDVEVLSLRIRGINFYPRSDHDQIGFSVKPGTHIENVEVIVQPRMRIRGRVVFKDETPLINARIHLRFRAQTVDETGNWGSGGRPRTDADGYFVYYLDEKDDAAFYTFAVEYQGLSAEAEPIRLDPGERLDCVKFTFDSEPLPPQPLPHELAFDPSATPPPPRRSVPLSEEVWIVNPANLHAYKRIYCETRDDAVAQAAEENAHLVTINDAAEQVWLAEVFGHKFYWIGLRRVLTTGALSKRTKKWWKWDNGDPITYANWLPGDFFSESLDASERDYAVMTITDGQWYAVGPDSLIWRMTEMAILEKPDMFDGSLTEEER